MSKDKINEVGDANLIAFVDSLVAEKKFPETLEPEVITEIKSDLLSRVEDRINGVIINNLSSEKIEEFTNLLDSEAETKEMQDFCLKNIPNLSQLIASELIVFRNSYLS